MAHIQQRDFILKVKSFFPEFFKGGDILEVGSLNINGTVRDFFESPKNYIGIDLMDGPGVDMICAGKDFDLFPEFPNNPGKGYDVVISTECFEHDKDWKDTFKNMHHLVHNGGMVMFTCASTGRHEHGTTRTSPQDSPATTDYYENRTEQDFISSMPIPEMFSKYAFEYNPVTCDLYFWGIKK